VRAATLSFTVPAMSCGHCEMAVKTEIAKLDGVREVEIDLATKEVVVRGDQLDAGAVATAVDEAGYEAVGLGGPDPGT
jgi:copper chaperone CopZ